ncbi:hypothetical protein [Limnoglobus roseus]|uniref:Lipoprotein n=1 Tax=Limnoglobus roseus TaxID=2598579 RepID=A0A5C1A955_9BACT|nr:hypothetical protein [Limnoglobus roseus]QEL14576.1 hypothetical protein PX52LOC_01466 [Limnoglobus roseus]
MKTIGFAVILMFAAGCVGPGRVTRDVQEPEQMAELVARLAPPGTSVDDAQRAMEREGFRCSRVVNGTFTALKGEERTPEEHEGIDFLKCWRSRDSQLSIISGSWSVAIVHKDSKVVEVLAYTALTGP